MTLTRALLRLYPRRWRDRYGDEFLSLVDGQPMGVQRFVDIVSGAVDAHFSLDINHLAEATPRAGHSPGVPIVMRVLRANCPPSPVTISWRTSLIGAAIIIGGTILCTTAEAEARRYGLSGTVRFLNAFSTPAATLAGTTFTFMRGQPWKARAVLIGGTLAIAAVICAGAAYR